MAAHQNPRPERPRAAGIEEEVPESPGIEGARLLANDAFPRLKVLGFSRGQVRLWAETYVADGSPGQVDEFVEWIRQREGIQGSTDSE